jgi:hypothetical protein
MSTTGARAAGTSHTPSRRRRAKASDPGPRRAERGGRTYAQLYCLLGGLSLLLAGVLGFFADGSFDVAGDLGRGSFLGFDVNGWHNVVHVLSGLVLLGAAGRRIPARRVAIGFGLVYGVVAIIGLVDGSDVLGIIPIDGADNALHVGLAALGVLAGLASPRPRHGHGHGR